MGDQGTSGGTPAQKISWLRHVIRTIANQVANYLVEWVEFEIAGRIVTDWLWGIDQKPPWIQPGEFRSPTLRALVKATLVEPPRPLDPALFVKDSPRQRLAIRAAQIGKADLAGHERWEELVEFVLEKATPLDEGHWGMRRAVTRLRLSNQFDRQLCVYSDSIEKLFKLIVGDA